jgi:hypothetical protein
MGGVPAEMEHAVPWSKVCALVEPVYPTGGKRPVIDQPGTDTADLLSAAVVQPVCFSTCQTSRPVRPGALSESKSLPLRSMAAIADKRGPEEEPIPVKNALGDANSYWRR